MFKSIFIKSGMMLLFFTLLATSGVALGNQKRYEFHVTEAHDTYKKKPFRANVFFTVESLPAKPGLEQEVLYAKNLVVEIYTYAEPNGFCPIFGFSHLRADESMVYYELPLVLGTSGTCSVEVSTPANVGKILPEDIATTYSKTPILLKVGKQKIQNRLYIQDDDGFREFGFNLADAL